MATLLPNARPALEASLKNDGIEIESKERIRRVLDLLLEDAEGRPPGIELKTKLQMKLTLEFVETPLEEVVTYLAKKCDFKLGLDAEANEKKRIGKIVVWLSVRDMDCERILRWIARSTDLTLKYNESELILAPQNKRKPGVEGDK